MYSNVAVFRENPEKAYASNQFIRELGWEQFYTKIPLRSLEKGMYNFVAYIRFMNCDVRKTIKKNSEMKSQKYSKLRFLS